MNQDMIWQLIRYGLIAGGTYLSAKGVVPAKQVASTVDTVMNVLPGVVAAGSALWGLYVKANTKAVPAKTAARPDVPTVSAATGALQ